MKIILITCIFTSSFLLFLIQPIIAKQIMPWFGGTSAVWTTCVMFFQVILLIGYAYADIVTRLLRPRTLAILHISLVISALAFLPVIPDDVWKPNPESLPISEALLLLVATIGLPYFCLSTTGPLLQTWFVQYFPQYKVYRLFALSNLASLIALLSYPFVIEPYSNSLMQSWWWSAGFILFVLLCVASSWMCRTRKPIADSVDLNELTNNIAKNSATPISPVDKPPAKLDYLIWLTLSALGSMLLLAVTNHITHNIASVPFLWLLPLSIYLFTFILCFDGKGWYQQRFYVGPLIIFPAVMTWGVYTNTKDIHMSALVAIYAIGLFICCMFYHGELNERKPSARYLARFYLILSLGGALGGFSMSAVVPYVFDNYYELPIILFATSALVLMLLKTYLTANRAAYAVLALGVLSSVSTALIGWSYFIEQNRDNIVMLRNFYASSRVTEFESKERGLVRVLRNGTIVHGMQIMSDTKNLTPTAYYGESSGVAYAINSKVNSPRNVGVIGLGVGTLAAYGNDGDIFRFYEINPHSKKIAENEFSFLKKSASTNEIILGDARLMLESELKSKQPNNFDVLVVDAFSSDSIPVHLLTKEAMDIYRQHMKEDGIIAIHVSNLFLNLAPVVEQLAGSIGWKAAYFRDLPSWPMYSSSWVLVSKDNINLENNADWFDKAKPIVRIPDLKLWTDGHNNLFKILTK